MVDTRPKNNRGNISLSGIGRGLAFLEEQREKMPQYGDRTMKLWLYAGDMAKIWFINDVDEVASPLIHGVARQAKSGKAYTKDVLCSRFTYDDPVEKCELCVAGEKGPWPRTQALVWVDSKFYTTRPEGNRNVEEIRRRGSNTVLYRERINAMYIFPMKSNIVDQIRSFVNNADDLLSEAPEEAMSEPRSLLPQPFTFERLENVKANSEQIRALPPETVPDEVVKLRKEAPDLIEVITDVYVEKGSTTFGSGSGNAQSAPAAAPATVAGDDERIEL